MPGSVKVSVLEAEHLPSTVEDGHLVSVRVSVGKREYQTKPSQAFGGRTTSWKYEFSYPVTNLRDNLVIAAIDSKEEIITKSEIQTTSIIQKGFWDTFFSFKGGGRLHLKLCFVLSDEERKKIELMRLEALRRKGLQNLLYRSTYQVPKPVPVRPTKSFVSGVTITEISADSCLYEKDNENKENHAGNMSLRCPKLLEAPKEQKSLDILNGSDTAVVPFSPQLDGSQAKANVPEVPSSQKFLPPASCEQIEKKCFKTKEDSRKRDEAHLPDSNESSFLLPEASAFMNDLVPSTVVSNFDHSHSPQFNLVPVAIPCETAATVAVANTGSAPMPESDVCISKSEIQPSMKLITDLTPFSNKSSPVSHTLSPLVAEDPVLVVNLQSAEDPSSVQSPTKAKTEHDIAVPEATLSDELTMNKSEDIMFGSASTGSTYSSFSLMEEMKPSPCTLQGTAVEQAHMGEASETLDEVAGIASSEQMQAVGQVGRAVVKDAANKLELEKEAEDGRQATSAIENIKVFKNLPWKSQTKGASGKFGWSVNKKRRTDNERKVLTGETDQLMESADSVKTNVISEMEASNKSVCGWAFTKLEPVVDTADKDTNNKKGFFCISVRMKKLVSVALLLAGVIILGCDAIQRDLASKKKDSYCTGKQGNNSCSVTSTQIDDHNIAKSSSIYPGQRIQLY